MIASLTLIPGWSQAQLGLSTELYSSATLATEEGDDTERYEIGSDTAVGYAYLLGPHQLTSGYTLAISRAFRDDFGSDATVSGLTRYAYTPNERFDFNLSHSQSFIAPEEDLLTDIRNYEQRTTVTTGAGFNVFPTAITRARISTQFTQIWNDDLDRDGHQLSLSTSGNRRFSNTETAELSLQRSFQWNGDNIRENRTDAINLSYLALRPNGALDATLGWTVLTNLELERSALTGSVSRQWEYDHRQTALTYTRAITNTLVELSLERDPTSDAGDEETLLRLLEESLVDQLTFNSQNNTLCDQCQLLYSAEFTTQELIPDGPRTFEYALSFGVNYRASSKQSMEARYRWLGQAIKLKEGPDAQQSRANLSWSRRMSSAIDVRASLEHSWEHESSQQRTTARLGVRIGLIE